MNFNKIIKKPYESLGYRCRGNAHFEKKLGGVRTETKSWLAPLIIVRWYVGCAGPHPLAFLSRLLAKINSNTCTLMEMGFYFSRDFEGDELPEVTATSSLVGPPFPISELWTCLYNNRPAASGDKRGDQKHWIFSFSTSSPSPRKGDIPLEHPL